MPRNKYTKLDNSLRTFKLNKVFKTKQISQKFKKKVERKMLLNLLGIMCTKLLYIFYWMAEMKFI